MNWSTWIILIVCAIFAWFLLGFALWVLFVNAMKSMTRAIEEAWDEPIYIHINIEESE